jgi:hypothetical protein
MDDASWTRTLDVIGALPGASFPLVLACLLGETTSLGPRPLDQQWSAVRRRLRLSNEEHRHVAWLLIHRQELTSADIAPWSRIQPILAGAPAVELVDWHEARGGATPALIFCREKLRLPREELDPPPLITGDDLMNHGVPAGELYSPLLREVRNAQLDGVLNSKNEALEFVDRRLAELRIVKEE